jgi:hypothetical protein
MKYLKIISINGRNGLSRSIWSTRRMLEERRHADEEAVELSIMLFRPILPTIHESPGEDIRNSPLPQNGAASNQESDSDDWSADDADAHGELPQPTPPAGFTPWGSQTDKVDIAQKASKTAQEATNGEPLLEPAPSPAQSSSTTPATQPAQQSQDLRAHLLANLRCRGLADHILGSVNSLIAGAFSLVAALGPTKSRHLELAGPSCLYTHSPSRRPCDMNDMEHQLAQAQWQASSMRPQGSCPPSSTPPGTYGSKIGTTRYERPERTSRSMPLVRDVELTLLGANDASLSCAPHPLEVPKKIRMQYRVLISDSGFYSRPQSLETIPEEVAEKGIGERGLRRYRDTSAMHPDWKG